MIIPANRLNAITREHIVNMFCENLMERIKEANARGQRCICFTASVYVNERTGEISSTYKIPEWVQDGVTPYKYYFDDYAEDVRRVFRENGYVIKPTGYSGGVWQKTEDIMW